LDWAISFSWEGRGRTRGRWQESIEWGQLFLGGRIANTQTKMWSREEEEYLEMVRGIVKLSWQISWDNLEII
jgi:hypothetical protein